MCQEELTPIGCTTTSGGIKGTASNSSGLTASWWCQLLLRASLPVVADWARVRPASNSAAATCKLLLKGMGEACGVVRGVVRGVAYGVARGVAQGVVRGVLRGVRPLGGGWVRDCRWGRTAEVSGGGRRCALGRDTYTCVRVCVFV